jgi:hypothetical protein
VDHRQTPCADSDFTGHRETQAYAPPLGDRMTLDASAPIVTGEYKIPWPPKSTLHRHPSNWMFWVVLAIVVMWAVCGIVGLVVVMQWLF